MHAAGDVRVENVPDPEIVQPTDAVVRVTRAAICGSDLWPYKSMEPGETGRQMGHEAIGVVEEVGAEVSSLNPGDLVLMPFAYSETEPASSAGTGCRRRASTAASSARRRSRDAGRGRSGSVRRRPLVVLPVAEDDALMPSLLALADVMGTGHHAAVTAKVGPGKTAAVVGDGAVGLCGVIAAKRLGAERIIIMGRHPARTELARQFGATDVVSERGDEAVERVHELTDGFGVHSVLECVGLEQSELTAIEIARPGGAVGRVGVPQDETMPASQPAFYNNVSVSGGPAPARAYVDELLPDVLEGRIEPGRVFDRTIGLEEVPEGYRAMNDREALKVLIEP
jgi:threonine dehydrogenase-like Zn-dependent dehydrogenase